MGLVSGSPAARNGVRLLEVRRRARPSHRRQRCTDNTHIRGHKRGLCCYGWGMENGPHGPREQESKKLGKRKGEGLKLQGGERTIGSTEEAAFISAPHRGG